MITPKVQDLISAPSSSGTLKFAVNVATNADSVMSYCVSATSTPESVQKNTATMNSSGVISVSASILGTTSARTGSTPTTASASSSSRTLRAPRSAQIAVPPTPATIIAVAQPPSSRTEPVTNV